MSAISSTDGQKTTKRIPWDFSGETALLEYKNVHTVCEESRCPNRHECSSVGVATFLVGGRECTRACKFCHIATAKPLPLASIADKEYDDIMQAAREGEYKYLVITSVARDDDEEGLARHFARLTQGLTSLGISVELLIPDFHAREDLLSLIAESGPVVMAHNMETVRRLSPRVRPQADYERSLGVMRFMKARYPNIIRKSAFMVGLGETGPEIETLLDDMQAATVDIVSIGQYLRPSADQAAVDKNYSRAEFEMLEASVERRNFLAWEVGPFVRSSYMAESTLKKLKAERERRIHGH